MLKNEIDTLIDPSPDYIKVKSPQVLPRKRDNIHEAAMDKSFLKVYGGVPPDSENDYQLFLLVRVIDDDIEPEESFTEFEQKILDKFKSFSEEQREDEYNRLNLLCNPPRPQIT